MGTALAFGLGAPGYVVRRDDAGLWRNLDRNRGVLGDHHWIACRPPWIACRGRFWAMGIGAWLLAIAGAMQNRVTRQAEATA